MGRGKIEIKRILKKAREISVLCDAEVGSSSSSRFAGRSICPALRSCAAGSSRRGCPGGALAWRRAGPPSLASPLSPLPSLCPCAARSRPSRTCASAPQGTAAGDAGQRKR
ncbi:hypothetical protein SEVIR_7G198051v4 [Setaria viridis]